MSYDVFIHIMARNLEHILQEVCVCRQVQY